MGAIKNKILIQNLIMMGVACRQFPRYIFHLFKNNSGRVSKTFAFSEQKFFRTPTKNFFDTKFVKQTAKSFFLSANGFCAVFLQRPRFFFSFNEENCLCVGKRKKNFCQLWKKFAASLIIKKLTSFSSKISDILWSFLKRKLKTIKNFLRCGLNNV